MAADSGIKANSMDTAHQLAGTAAFAFFFCLYALTASPAMGWLDSPEFVAQALTLGVAHSPGHPLVGLLGYAASIIPVGDTVWRVNLMSSLCAALTVTLLFACAYRVIAAVAPRVGWRSSLALALSVAAVAGGSWALWSNAVRAEVYALQALLSVGALFALLRYELAERPRDLLLASLCLALGLANHHLMALLILLPAAVFVLWRKQRPSLRLASQSFGLGVLGLSALLYLPVRSLAHPLVNFGAPHSLDRFVWTLRGAAFSKSVGQEHASTPMVDTVQIMAALFDAATVPLALLALLGIWLGLRQVRHRRFTLLLCGILLLTIAARVALGFDPETPDHHAYLLPAIFALYLLAIAGLAQLCNMALTAPRPLPKAPAITALALALLVPMQLIGNERSANQADSWASDDLAHWSVQGLPPSSIVLSAYFQTRFRLWALQAVEGHRPDIAILDRSFLTYPGMAAEAKARYPELAEIIDSPLRAGHPSPMPLLQALSTERPIYAELHPNLDPALAAALAPRGAFARFGARADLDTADHEARTLLAERLVQASPAERSDARAALLWHDATRLSHFCFLKRHNAAARVYADALLLAPDDTMLEAMASACGLKKP